MATPRNSSYTDYNGVQLNGSSEVINSQTIVGYLVDTNGNVFYATGTATVTDGSSGYAKGCIFVLTNATTGSACVYLNKGSTTSSQFTLVTQA